MLIHTGDGKASVPWERRQRSAADHLLRYCGIRLGVGRDREPLTDRPQETRPDQDVRYAYGEDHRSERARGARAAADVPLEGAQLPAESGGSRGASRVASTAR